MDLDGLVFTVQPSLAFTLNNTLASTCACICAFVCAGICMCVCVCPFMGKFFRQGLILYLRMAQNSLYS